jgi:hypothetical protein
MALDMENLHAFLDRFVTDLGAAFHAGMVVIGEKLGLCKALADSPLIAAELAAKAGTDERYVRESLSSQAASGYVSYDAATRQFSLSEEQIFALAVNNSPAYIPGAFELAVGALRATPRLIQAFQTSAGMGWHEHHEDVFHSCEKFFRPGNAAHLVSTWIPALGGVEAKLKEGARVADVGCGNGASTLLMAQKTGLRKRGLSQLLKKAGSLWLGAGARQWTLRIASCRFLPLRSYGKSSSYMSTQILNRVFGSFAPQHPKTGAFAHLHLLVLAARGLSPPHAGLWARQTPHCSCMKEVTDQILPYLTPSEQAVYLRLWRLTQAEANPRCALRYEDLARFAHVSLSTLKRVLKKLAHRGLVQVEWQTKRASLFTVHVHPLAPSPTIDLGLSPKLYDFFSNDDRALFLSCKRSLSPQDQRSLDQEAGGNPLHADILLFQRTFGPDRQRKYEDLLHHLTHNSRPK